MRPLISTCASLLTCLSASMIPAPAQADIQSTDYPSVQAAIDANPGRMIYVPNGDHLLTTTVMITTTGTGLCGPGRLVMTDASKDIINVREANDVTIRDIKLFRERGKHDGGRNGIFAAGCEGLTIDGVSVINNCGENAGLKIEHCTRLTVRNCLVRDYKAMTIDDRTRNPEAGYAFKCVDGNGMKFMDCKGAQITNNRIIETVFRATKENRDKYELGKVTVIPEKPGRYTPEGLKENPYTSNWHQGSALFFGEQGEGAVLSGNYIENAAQGFDVHADSVTITGNIVNGALVGAKAMHGSKHVIISNNQFRRVDLYGILLASGGASHDAVEASGAGEPAKGPNVDGGAVITGNIISDYGFGDQYWSTGSSPGASLYAISLEDEPDAPPLRDVVIANNVVYDTGRDKVIVEGRPQVVPPRYLFALVAQGIAKDNLQSVRIHGNIFHPGSAGVSNFELPPQ